MGEPSEAEELAFASFWDKRYDSLSSAENKPTHEWFRGFDSLRPWFSKHLFTDRPPEGAPTILQLGCGDSVLRPKSELEGEG